MGCNKFLKVIFFFCLAGILISITERQKMYLKYFKCLARLFFFNCVFPTLLIPITFSVWNACEVSLTEAEQQLYHGNIMSIPEQQ